MGIAKPARVRARYTGRSLRIVGRVMVLAVGLVLLATDASAAPSLPKLRVAITSHSPIYAPLYLAERQGLFDSLGVDVEIVNAGGGTKVAAGLSGGSFPVGLMAVDHVFAATVRGQGWVMIGSVLNREPYTFAMRKDVAQARGITEASPLEQRLKALKGLTIGVSTLGSGTHLTLAWAMSEVGLDPDKDARWIPIGDPLAIVSALERKQLDVGGRSPGPAEIAVKRGIGVMIVDFSKDLVGGKDYPTIVAVTTRQQIQARRADIQKLIQGLAAGLEMLHKRPEESVRTLRADFAKMDEEAYELAIAFVMRSLPERVGIGREEFQAALTHHQHPYLTKARGEELKATYEEVVDNSFAEKAREALLK